MKRLFYQSPDALVIACGKLQRHEGSYAVMLRSLSRFFGIAYGIDKPDLAEQSLVWRFRSQE